MISKVVGFYDNAADAGRLVLELVNDGFARADIDLFAWEESFGPGDDFRLEQGGASAHPGTDPLDGLRAVLEEVGTADVRSREGISAVMLSNYLDGVRRGGAVVAVRVNENKTEQAFARLSEHGPADMSMPAGAAGRPGAEAGASAPAP
ncbi:MAG: hypothetical protein ACOY5C_04670 [Pseudomonadota bacterium]|uniref:hypothetical protein n=1 Tax=Thermithiobacillus tepidarius TaxID=929 RepID=UPI00041ED67A|nr:hypothetical protein [Thermithiobacillus tepidarius]